MPILFLALIIIPLLEIALFIQFGAVLGISGTLFLILLTAIIGLLAVRRQGLATLANMQQSQQGGAQQSGHAPVAAAMHGVLIVLAGILLLLPGFLTDALGFLLLWRGARSLLLETILGFLIARAFAGFTNFTPSDNKDDDKSEIIEGEYRIDDEN